jgi:hypothetical protein
MNDEVVSVVSISKVLKQKAYILFYAKSVDAPAPDSKPVVETVDPAPSKGDLGTTSKASSADLDLGEVVTVNDLSRNVIKSKSASSKTVVTTTATSTATSTSASASTAPTDKDTTKAGGAHEEFEEADFDSDESDDDDYEAESDHSDWNVGGIHRRALRPKRRALM